ncbi:MAG: ribosomal protein S18-alanine N-acetyltransferase [Deltaproteobacteria bacterium]|nr:ribosomal protein S18-alanine N-acetyltransferase [Deltaproteobacteria bacterium]
MQKDVINLYKIERENFTDPWSIGVIQDMISDDNTYSIGIFKDNTIIAYSFFWILDEELHLLSLSVKKENQGKGLGKKLLAAVIEMANANKCKVVLLEVSENNQNAIKLYKASGFVTVGKRKNYYSDQSDAILMDLELKR